MGALVEKVTLTLQQLGADDFRSDAARLEEALANAGFEGVRCTLNALRGLYPAAREGAIAVTLVHQADGVVATRVQPADQSGPALGLACDLGSTSVSMELVEVVSGTTLAAANAANEQIEHGTDILTRITYGLEGADARRDLQLAAIRTINALIDEVVAKAGVQAADVGVLVLSGNTTMQHMLLGLNAWPIFSAPFAPVTLNPGFIDTAELELNVACPVYFMPAASNYIGGDIMSGLLVADFWRRDEVGLFFDVGTNGELVMGNKDWLLAGSGAAGPALEGYVSEHGMRAQPGAIDSVCIEGAEVVYTTVDGAAPCGICGSGLIDLVAQMRLAGWMGIDGKLIAAASPTIREVANPLVEGATQLAVCYAPATASATGEDLLFTQHDLGMYLATKAAAFGMIDCMLGQVGFEPADIDQLTLTGAFPLHANLEHAITIGMFPDVPRERYSCLPNASLQGAHLLLCDRTKLADLEYLTSHVYTLQFAFMPEFVECMAAARFVPHTDTTRFPTVMQQLQQ